ncbi:MAG: hypothetical protein U0869_25490 [Chloroflexota bacterium]
MTSATASRVPHLEAAGQECQVCGSRRDRVHATLSRTSDERAPFQALVRCVDVETCQVRVLASGRSWPIIEARPLREGVRR